MGGTSKGAWECDFVKEAPEAEAGIVILKAQVGDGHGALHSGRPVRVNIPVREIAGLIAALEEAKPVAMRKMKVWSLAQARAAKAEKRPKKAVTPRRLTALK